MKHQTSISYFRSSIVHRGFTLIELLITLSIVSILVTLITINLAKSSSKISLQTAASSLATDIKQQQIKAMIGDTTGNSDPDVYGIYFDTEQYVLFRGATYNPNASDNLAISYGDGVSLRQITFPSNVIIFSRVSGEIENFTTGSNSFVLESSSNDGIRTFTLNYLGVLQISE